MEQASHIERKLAAILSADVKGFSRLMGEDEEATLRTLTSCRRITDALIQQHRGRIVGTAGDSILAEFASVIDAIQCAVGIQTALKIENAELSPERRMEFRIGINLGDVMVEGEQIYGDGVNIAARLEALAEAGGICISEAVYEQIRNKLALSYEDLGEQALKNIAEPVRVWRVVLDVPSPLVGEGQGEGAAGRTGAAKTSLNTQDSALKTQLQPALPLPDKPSIVVLPFLNLSSDPEQEYFSDGITEDLTSDLSKLSGFFVIARNSAFTYKGKAVKVQEVSKELGVRYVLEGSIRKAGSRIRITAQLIDATTSYHLWSERYDRELKDIFALQDEIVQEIVTALRVEVLEAERQRVKRIPTGNLTAYDYVLRGWEYYHRINKETNAQARQMFEKAIALDPEYAEGYAGIGWTYWMERVWQWSQDPEAPARALEFAQKALARNNSLPLAHQLLGQVYLFARKLHEQAMAEGEQAIALDPNDADGYARLSLVLLCMGQPEEAIRLIEKAMRLNPRYPAWYLLWLGHAYSSAGRLEDAITTQKRAVTVNPNFPGPHIALASLYSRLEREDEARTEAAEVLRLNPDFSVESYRQGLAALRDQSGVERNVVALRKAGLK